MRSELGESLDHLALAAAQGASLMGATTAPRWESTKAAVIPRVDQVRGAAQKSWDTTWSAISPLVVAAAAGAAQANEQARKAKKTVSKKAERRQKAESNGKGKRVMTGMLVVGVAAGAGAAYVARRRNRAKWEEYDASFEAPVASDITRDAMSSTAEKAGETTGSWRNETPEKPVGMAEKTHNAADKAGEKARDSKDQAAAKAEEMAEKAANAAKNSRS